MALSCCEMSARDYQNLPQIGSIHKQVAIKIVRIADKHVIKLILFILKVLWAHGLHLLFFPVCPVYNVLIGLPSIPKKTACF